MTFWEVVKRRKAWLLDGLRTRLWPVPLIGVVTAAAAGVLLAYLDGQFDGRLPTFITEYLFGGGPAAARGVLSTIAASMITVTSLTFSLTLVTLQLAAGQFSPRLLRTFARDRFVQRTLALFVATFVYALTVLRAVRSGRPGQPDFVPQLSVTFGYLLALVSAVSLVVFLGHLVRQIRIETILETVQAEAINVANAMLEEFDDAEVDGILPIPPPDAVAVNAQITGFLLGVDERNLVDAATRVHGVVAMDRMPGEWLVAGTPVALAWPAGGGRFDDEDLDAIRRCVAEAVRIGEERTQVQDLAYGLRQLTDVAIKALSPGINDPTTAVHVLGHSSALLCDLAGRRLGPTVHRDADGVARVLILRPELVDLLELAVAQPRRYGAADAEVQSGLLRLLRELAWCTSSPEHKSEIAIQLSRSRRTVSSQDFDEVERDHLECLALAVDEALTGRWRVPPRARG